MRTRRAEVDLTWNGAAVTSKMENYKSTVTYTDPASGEADSLEISLNDRDRQWTTAWLPKTGDTLTAAIKVYDWNQEGDNRTLDCGFFILDNYTFSWWPMEGTISAVSVPADSAFRATQRTKTWEKATLQAIGTEIAARAGITLVWDVEGEPITVESVEQSEQTDCEFYMSLCEEYGLSMKVYAQKSPYMTGRSTRKRTPWPPSGKARLRADPGKANWRGPIPAGSTPTRTRPPRRRSKSRWGPGPGS